MKSWNYKEGQEEQTTHVGSMAPYKLFRKSTDTGFISSTTNQLPRNLDIDA